MDREKESKEGSIRHGHRSTHWLRLTHRGIVRAPVDIIDGEILARGSHLHYRLAAGYVVQVDAPVGGAGQEYIRAAGGEANLKYTHTHTRTHT